MRSTLRKSILGSLLGLLVAGSAFATTPLLVQWRTPLNSSNCVATTPQWGQSDTCYDTTLHAWYYWNYSSPTCCFVALPAGAGAIVPPAGDIGGTNTAPTILSTHLSSPLPIAQGGTASSSPGLIGGTNVNVTGSWPNQTISAPTNLSSYTGAIGVTGNSGNGSDFIKNTCTNGKCPVTAFGAVHDCSTDDWQAIQNAAGKSCTLAGSGSNNASMPVLVPAAPNSCYSTHFPIWLNCTNSTPQIMAIEGDGGYGDSIIKANGYFPTLFASDSGIISTIGTPTAASLVGATGASLQFASGKPWAIDLKSLLSQTANGVQAMNGLSAWTVEFALNVNDTNNGDTLVPFDSSGTLNAYFINRGSSTNIGLLTVEITIASAGAADTVTISSTTNSGNINRTSCGTLTSNATHYFAVSYDGAHAQCYIDGTRNTNAALTGTSIDNYYQGMLYGNGNVGWGNIDTSSPFYGKLDALRISNSTRYTGASMSVPSSKFAGDANTVLLINGNNAFPTKAVNGSNVQFPFIGADYLWGSAQNAWTIPQGMGGVQVVPIIKNLTLTGGSVGLQLNSAASGHVADVNATGGYKGLYPQTTATYAGEYDNVQADLSAGTGLAAFFTETDAGLFNLLNIGNCGYACLIDLGQGNTYNYPLTLVGSGVAATWVFGGGSNEFSPELINNWADDNENGSTGVQMVINSYGNLTVNGCSIQGANSTTIPIQIGNTTGRSGLGLTLNNVDVSGINASTSEIISSAAARSAQNVQITWISPRINGKLYSANTIPLTDANTAPSLVALTDQGWLGSMLQFQTLFSAAGTAIPAASSANAHTSACVSDSTACIAGTTYTSGGSTNCHLHSVGSTWKEDGFGC